jgi:hypothetical protein
MHIDYLKISLEMNKTDEEKLEILLYKLGSTWILDSIYLFLIVPLSIIGFLLNIISFILINKIVKNKSNQILFEYMRICSLNGVLACFIGFFGFLYAPRYNGIKLDLFSRFFRCIIVNFVLPTIYFFENILNIIILHDRLSIFIKRIVLFKKRSPWIESVIVLIFCTIINSPILFRLNLYSNEELFESNILYDKNLSLCKLSLIPRNSPIIPAMVIIRDIGSLIIELILSIFSLIYFKKFINTKKKIKSQVQPSMVFVNDNENEQENKTNHNLTLFTLILSAMSIICHFAVFMATVLSTFSSKYKTYRWIMIANLFVLIKYTSNFFILYFFNKTFKSYLFQYLKVKK